MTSFQLTVLMDKLYGIDKKLGGTAASQKGSGDEFESIKEAIVAKLHAFRKKMEQKEGKPRNADTIRMEVEMKDMLNDIEQLLMKMNETLRKQAKDRKKYSEQNIAQKQKIYDNLRQQVSDIQTIMDPNGSMSSNSSRYENIETVTDMKSKLMADGKGGRNAPPKEATAEEKAALDRWKQNDQQIDSQLDTIIAGTALWKENAQKIGNQIDHTTMQINKLDKEVDITNAELEKQNKALKQIVEKYRQPNKFCMDIVLICVLLGLATGIYSMCK